MVVEVVMVIYLLLLNVGEKMNQKKAILELESRGFEVVGRGEREVVANSWSYSDSKLKYENAYAMQGTQGGRMYYARVRKKPVEMAVSTGG